MPVTGIWDGSQWLPIQGLQGPVGPSGTDGTDGTDGATGPQGDQGPPGPSSVSTDAGNEATLGSDQLIYVPDFASGTFLPLAGGTMAGIINMANNELQGVKLIRDSAIVSRIDLDTIGTNILSPSGASAISVDTNANISLNGRRLYDISDPTSNGDVGDRNYNDARYMNLTGNTMAGTINMNSNRITNLPNPSENGDATTRAYVNNGDLANVSKTGDTMSGILVIARINGSGVGHAGGLLVVGGDLDITTSPSTTTGANMFWQAVDGRVYNTTSLAVYKDNVVPLTPAAAEIFIGAFDGVEYDSLLDPRSNVGFIAEHAELADPRINSVRDLSEPLSGIQDRVVVAYHHTALQDLYARVAALEP
jgi:hypothetical protein